KPVSVDMDLDVESRQPAIKGNVTFDGVVDVEQSFSAIKLNDIAVVLDLVGETLPGGRLQSSLKTSAVIDLEQETLSTSFLKLSALGLNVNGNIQGQAIKSAERQFAGDFQVATFSPADVMRALGLTVPVTSDNTVLEKADMSTHLVLTSDTVQLSKLAMRLDDSLINGRVAVSDFAKPAINFEIGLDQIDADRYFPPTTETDAETVVKAATVPVEVPVDMLRALNVNGEIKIGLLKAYQLRSQDIKIQLSARNGKIQVHPAQAKMYEGSYRGNIQLDVRSTPKLSMDEKFSGIQVGGLLMDMMKKETITGDTEAHVKLSGTGKTLDAIKQTLNGEMGFTFKDGAIKGVDLIRLIRQAKSAIKGQNPMEKSGSDQTDFSVLSATATVKNGVVTSDDLSAKSPLLRIDGKGMVDLNQQSIDYLLTTTIVGSLEGQGGRDISDLNGLPIPIQVTGSFAQPKYKLRLDKAIKQAAGEEIRQKVDAEKAKLKEKVDKKKAELEEKVDKKKQALEDKLKDKLNDKLKGLFN
ncbi:MAG: AsmA family protein, partial [Gammaproteobacteria bacterium]